tara:strand:- start:7 stop:636 length:630 start_codon:yes stop_codon:yes gene_type:complete
MIGYIYKIHCNKTNEDYYGSTAYIHRVSSHKCSTDLNLSKRQCTSRQIIDRNDWTFTIIEEVEYEDKTELKIRERYYFDNFKCVNKVTPYATPEEIAQRKSERGKSEKGKAEKKAYYEANKEDLKRKSREYHAANKEKASEQKKVYREANREEINRKKREYHEANKEALYAHKAERIQCGCGVEHTRGKIARHKRSQKHTDWVKSQENA